MEWSAGVGLKRIKTKKFRLNDRITRTLHLKLLRKSSKTTKKVRNCSTGTKKLFKNRFPVAKEV